MVRKRLMDSDDYIDFKTSTKLAMWSTKPAGARWGVMKTTCALYRTELGNLVATVPGGAFGIPYFLSVALTFDCMQVTPEVAVDLMAKSGGLKHAKRLFPELANAWQDLHPPAARCSAMCVWCRIHSASRIW
jgi:hypothetical protein